MEVTKSTFPFRLASILHDLSVCSFVALDFEFSGVAPRQKDGGARSKQTLQQRYAETKKAAEKYQILQIGLTVALEDLETGTYTLKPYNFHLSPLIDPQLEVERTWSYQSGAVQFLLRNGFRMDAPFNEGIAYISRAEQREAISKVLERHDRDIKNRACTNPCSDTGAPLASEESETESAEFLLTVRQMINAWLEEGERAPRYLNIPPPSSRVSVNGETTVMSTLNKNQKLLVHKLVEREFPKLVSIGKSEWVKIIHYDEAREDAIHQRRMHKVQERCRQQTGFRWIIEALVGGDLSKLHDAAFSSLVSNSGRRTKQRAVKEAAEGIRSRLQENRPVVVGHNLLTDMIYLWRCFLGDLPETVEEFQEQLHEHFPLLIDTKYLATHGCGSINPVASLTEVYEGLKDIEGPKFVIHPDHGKYNHSERFHEAGYDSLLTAQIFLKLASQLPKVPPGGNSHTSDTGSEGSQHTATSPGSIDTNSLLNPGEIPFAPITQTEAPLQEHAGSEEKAVRGSSIQSRFAHGNLFDALAAEDSVGQIDDSGIAGASHTLTNEAKIQEMIAEGKLIPRFESRIWDIYGNKLRVFGTVERVCPLGRRSPTQAL